MFLTKIGIIPIKYADLTIHDLCPKCSCERDFNLHLIQNSFLIGFPLFPTSKEQILTCTVCKNRHLPNNLSKENQDKINKLLKLKKPSPFYFTFGILIVMLMVFVLFKSGLDKQTNKSYINDPKVGDIYCIGSEEDGILGKSTTYNYYQVSSFSAIDIELKKESETPRITEYPERISSVFNDLEWGADKTLYSKTTLLKLNEISLDKQYEQIFEIWRDKQQ